MSSNPSSYVLELDFTPQDLLANQMGEVSPRQRAMIEAVYATRGRYAGQSIKWMWVFFPLLMLFGVFNEYNTSGNGDFITFMGGTGVYFLIPLGIFAVITLLNGVVSRWYGRHVRELRIHSAEGYARIYVGTRHTRYGTHKIHEVKLVEGRHRFIMRFSGPSPLDYFEQGKFYRVYYIPFYPLPLLLSVEPA